MPLNTAQLKQMQRELNAQVLPDARLSGTLSIHYGADGQPGGAAAHRHARPGKDGFSPTITVFKEDQKTYILEITDVNGTYLTPNLITYIEGSADIRPLIAGKLDADLAPYAEVDPVTLSVSQRNSAYLYVRRDDKDEGNKITLSTIALKEELEEVEEKIKRKFQTLQDLDTANWEVGDYIFLEMSKGED